MKKYVWGDDSLLENVYRFDYTSQTCGGFEMADLHFR